MGGMERVGREKERERERETERERERERGVLGRVIRSGFIICRLPS